MSIMRSFPRLVALAGIAACVLTGTGCAGTRLFDWNKPPAIPTADEQNPAVRIVCVWEPSEGHGVDGLPTRGFAGRIMFFTHNSPTPVKVDGDVRIYEYDNLGTREEQSKPIHQFDFIGDSWTTHFHRSQLGPSYQVFIPYVRKSPWLAQCALRIRLTPPNGRPLFSELVYVTLPGPLPPQNAVEMSPLATFRKSPDLADVKLGATVDHSRRSAADSPRHQETGDAQTARGGSTSVTQIGLTGDREAASSRQGETAAVLPAHAEIEQLLRSRRESQAAPVRQVAPQPVPVDAVEEAVPSAPARRYQLIPAAGQPNGGPAAQQEDEFDAFFSGRATRAVHPLAEMAFDDHPLAGM